MINIEQFIQVISSIGLPLLMAIGGAVAWYHRQAGKKYERAKAAADQEKTITETAITLAKELRAELKVRQGQVKELEARLDEFETRIDVLETVATRLAHGVIMLADQMAHEGIKPNWRPSGMVKAFIDQFVEEVYPEMGEYRGHKKRVKETETDEA